MPGVRAPLQAHLARLTDLRNLYTSLQSFILLALLLSLMIRANTIPRIGIIGYSVAAATVPLLELGCVLVVVSCLMGCLFHLQLGTHSEGWSTLFGAQLLTIENIIVGGSPLRSLMSFLTHPPAMSRT